MLTAHHVGLISFKGVVCSKAKFVKLYYALFPGSEDLKADPHESPRSFDLVRPDGRVIE